MRKRNDEKIAGKTLNNDYNVENIMPNIENTGMHLAQKTLGQSVAGIGTKNAEVFFNALYEALDKTHFEQFLNKMENRYKNKDISKGLDTLLSDLCDDAFNFNRYLPLSTRIDIQLLSLLDSFDNNSDASDNFGYIGSVRIGNASYLHKLFENSTLFKKYKENFCALSQRRVLDIKPLTSKLVTALTLLNEMKNGQHLQVAQAITQFIEKLNNIQNIKHASIVLLRDTMSDYVNKIAKNKNSMAINKAIFCMREVIFSLNAYDGIQNNNNNNNNIISNQHIIDNIVVEEPISKLKAIDAPMSIAKILGEVKNSALHLYGSKSTFYIIHEVNQRGILNYILINANVDSVGRQLSPKTFFNARSDSDSNNLPKKTSCGQHEINQIIIQPNHTFTYSTLLNETQTEQMIAILDEYKSKKDTSVTDRQDLLEDVFGYLAYTNEKIDELNTRFQDAGVTKIEEQNLELKPVILAGMDAVNNNEMQDAQLLKQEHRQNNSCIIS